MSNGPVLSTLEAYERWAKSYAAEPHNPLMWAEQRSMLENLPELDGRRVLDLACGTGRYAKLAAARHAAAVVAVDFSAAMLRQVATGSRVLADMTRLPFAAEAFDAVISGLAIGHAADVGAWMSEVARVLRPGGALLYSDFHPDAALRGLSRSFKDEDQRSHCVPHACHTLAAQRHAAERARLTVEVVRELRVGIEFREEFAGAEEFYRRHFGTPLVLVVRAHK